MFKILILLIAAFVIFIIVRKPNTGVLEENEDETKEKLITYVCPECGEKDCNCYKEDSTHKH